jgi:hypothetical protein
VPQHRAERQAEGSVAEALHGFTKAEWQKDSRKSAAESFCGEGRTSNLRPDALRWRVRAAPFLSGIGWADSVQWPERLAAGLR